jgi:hypothetical protein
MAHLFEKPAIGICHEKHDWCNPDHNLPSLEITMGGEAIRSKGIPE